VFGKPLDVVSNRATVAKDSGNSFQQRCAPCLSSRLTSTSLCPIEQYILTNFHMSYDFGWNMQILIQGEVAFVRPPRGWRHSTGLHAATMQHGQTAAPLLNTGHSLVRSSEHLAHGQAVCLTTLLSIQWQCQVERAFLDHTSFLH
jgi:hypothetical protein